MWWGQRREPNYGGAMTTHLEHDEASQTGLAAERCKQCHTNPVDDKSTRLCRECAWRRFLEMMIDARLPVI
jgi:hypothetical protein